MGYDLIGLKPKNKKGKCFLRNVFGWHPLWTYVCEIVNGVLTEKQKQLGRSNNGVKIDEKQCKVIAQLLRKEMETGNTKMYEKGFKEYVKNTEEPCEACGGTGIKEDDFTVGEPHCSNGVWTVKLTRQCPFSEETVKEFVEFLQNCGGFEIW